jgi:integrase
VSAKNDEMEKQLQPLNKTVAQVITDVLAAHQILPGWTIAQMAGEIRKRHASIKQYLTVPAVVERYVQHLKSDFKREYSDDYIRQQQTVLEKFAEPLTNDRIDLVMPETVKQFVVSYRVVPVGTRKAEQAGTDGLVAATPKTKDAVYNALRGLFIFARDILCALPSEERTAPQRMKRPKRSRRTPDIFTPDEVAAILGVLPDLEFVLFAAVQAFAGLRGCEAMQLRGEDFIPDPEQNGKLTQIKVAFPKRNAHGDGTSRIRFVPITEPLADLLGKLTLPAGKIFKRTALVASLPHYARLAGVEWKHDALRHSFVTYRLLATKNRPMVAMEAGHTVLVQLEHYEGLAKAEDVKPYWATIIPNAGRRWQTTLPCCRTLEKQLAKLKAEQAGAKGKA